MYYFGGVMPQETHHSVLWHQNTEPRFSGLDVGSDGGEERGSVKWLMSQQKYTGWVAYKQQKFGGRDKSEV